jgi:hypothetical protein
MEALPCRLSTPEVRGVDHARPAAQGGAQVPDEVHAQTIVVLGPAGHEAQGTVQELPAFGLAFLPIQELVGRRGVAQGGVPDFRPRFPDWPAISEIVAEWGTKMMLGEVTTEQGAQEIGGRMEEILGKSGYYDGQKKLLK